MKPVQTARATFSKALLWLLAGESAFRVNGHISGLELRLTILDPSLTVSDDFF
jgi:hypothetical protein